MRPSLRLIAFSVVFGLSAMAQANTVSNFSLNGNFANGGTLGGTLAIDITSGNALSAQLILNDVDGVNVNEYIVPTGQGPALGNFQIGFNPNLALPGESLDLLLPAATLVGYTGGVLCGTVTNACTFGFTSNFIAFSSAGTVIDPLVSGSLTPVPEPARLALAATSLLGALCALRRRPSALRKTLRNSGPHHL